MLMAAPYSGPPAVTPDDEDFYRSLGKRIADLRTARDMTQQQLADELGLSQKTVGHYEMGRIRLQISMLPALANSLGVTIQALLAPLLKAPSKHR
jgi:transcriptional regulator with XRE-family HTH domain